MLNSSLGSNVAIDAVTILEQPESITSRTLTGIVPSLAKEESARESLAALTAVLLLVPDFADYIPPSVLDQCAHIKSASTIWENLVLLLLHSEQCKEIVNWLKSKWLNNDGFASLLLLQYISDWFPQELDIHLLETIAKQNNSISSTELFTEVLERQMFYRNVSCFNTIHQDCLLSEILSGPKQLLVVHNINDGQGDEIVRLYALLQAFLDGFSELEITLFTDRLYLYDHPRVQTISIFDTTKLKLTLKNNCDSIINFFEQHLPSSSYNLGAQSILVDYLNNQLPPFYLYARKDINHFTFESVVIKGTEYATAWKLDNRRLALNYDTTARLIDTLGLPHRFGEQIPKGGFLPAAKPYKNVEDIVKSWESLKTSLANRTGESNRLITIVNIFGGQNQMKGYMAGNFIQLASQLTQLIQEGYNLVLVPNGKGWGSLNEIEAIINCLSEDMRKYIFAAPISSLQTPQETMRQIKYFVLWSDLVVTIEGWMMHLAYALGKPYRILMAPYSYPSEWHPHGRSANQRHWIPVHNQKRRIEFALPVKSTAPVNESIKPPLLHYPEKDLFKAALKIWQVTGNCHLGKELRFWMASSDKDIRSWIVTTIGKIDPVFFQSELVNALADKNRTVRACAARMLLDSEQDLTSVLGIKWQEILFAYQLVGEFRFQELRPLQDAAYPSLKACLNGDSSSVSRDATIIADEMRLNISE